MWEGTLIGDILDEMAYREVYKATEYAPFYLASYATHMFNLYNQEKYIYWIGGTDIPNFRLHLLNVAPPGFMKSYFLKLFIGGQYSIFGDTVEKTFENEITAAALVGSIRSENGMMVKVDGVAKKFSRGIVGVDEFSAITKMKSTQHSGHMDTLLLTILDSGDVDKSLAYGKFKYVTYLTLWGGVQPQRFDISAGMGRRLCYLVFIPTPEEENEIFDATEASDNIKPDVINTRKIWKELEKFKREIRTIKKIEFDVGDYLKKNLVPHYEISIYKKLLLGIELMKGVDETMFITTKDPVIRNFVDTEITWRRQIVAGGDFIQITKILESYGGAIDVQELELRCNRLGWDTRTLYKVLGDMQKMYKVKRTESMIQLL